MKIIGERLGSYEIVEVLGQGGMGTVYRAVDPHHPRDVAIKTIRPDRENAILRAAFEREARITSAISHPGIVTILDIFQYDDHDCIVMEYVAGEPLSRLIPRRGLPEERAIPLAIQIADALQAAHSKGIVHRDLKPGNIVVQDGDRIKILDFGLAKIMESATREDQTKTISLFGTGAAVGTLAYMAPEQARGESVDHRADIFALGVLLYNMLTGTLPFRAPNPAVLIHALQYEDPKPLRSLNGESPAWLDRVIHRALRKQARDRFAHVSEMADALRAAGSDEPLPVSSESGAPLTPSGIASGLSMQSATSRPPSTGTEEASIAVMPFLSVSGEKDDEYLAAGIASELTSLLTGVPGLRIASHLAAFKLQELGSDPRRVAGELNVRYVVSGSVRRSGQKIRVTAELFDAVQSTVAWTRSYDRVLTGVFEVQEDLAVAIVGSLGGQLIRANTDFAVRTATSNLDAWGLARKAYHIWNYQFSVEGVAESIGLLRRAVEIDPEYAAAHAYLGMYLIQSVIHGLSPDGEGDRKAAQEAVERAIELAPADPIVLENASLVLLHCGHYGRAVKCAKLAVHQAPYDLVAWGYLGFAHAVAGTAQNAKDAIKILDHLIVDAPDHPSIPYWLQFALIACLRLDRFEDAVGYGRRCFEMQPGFVFQQVMLGEALARLNQIDEAREVLATISAYNPYFSLAAFEAVAHVTCGSQAIADQLCGQVKALGLLH